MTKGDELYKCVSELKTTLTNNLSENARLQQRAAEVMDEFKIKLSTYVAEVSAQNTVTNAKLQNIDEHLSRLNSKVASHERIINERAEVISDYRHFKEALSELPTKIRTLEDCALSNLSVKKFIVGVFAGGISIGGLVVAIIALL